MGVSTGMEKHIETTVFVLGFRIFMGHIEVNEGMEK